MSIQSSLESGKTSSVKHIRYTEQDRRHILNIASVEIEIEGGVRF